ncbi:MAG: NAD-dependent epimerase/dehydratase family protein, partial [Chloroflexota bacterium]
TEALRGVKHPSLELMEGGIENAAKVKEAVSGVEVIYHLAETFSSNPYEVLDTDIRGNLNLLEAARASGIRHFLFASTHRVYGAPRHLPVDEEHPLHPEESGRAVYASAKLFNEKLCLTYWQEQKLPITIFRFWWAISDKIGGRVLRHLIDSALKGETIRVPEKTGGNFLHNNDAALAFRRAMLKNEAFGQVLNISSGTYTTWREIAGLILELTGSKSRLEFVTSGMKKEDTIIAADPSIAYECNLDISKAAKLTGFNPQYTAQELTGLLREAIKNLVATRMKR